MEVTGCEEGCVGVGCVYCYMPLNLILFIISKMIEILLKY